jgi:hypothetical protein
MRQLFRIFEVVKRRPVQLTSFSAAWAHPIGTGLRAARDSADSAWWKLHVGHALRRVNFRRALSDPLHYCFRWSQFRLLAVEKAECEASSSSRLQSGCV